MRVERSTFRIDPDFVRDDACVLLQAAIAHWQEAILKYQATHTRHVHGGMQSINVGSVSRYTLGQVDAIVCEARLAESADAHWAREHAHACDY